MPGVLDAAVADARTLVSAGFDALMVENYGDVPFHPDSVPAATVAALTAAVQAIRDSVDVPVGVNVLRNDVSSALGVAAATGASFVRVNVHVGAMWTDQGLLQGQAADTLRLRTNLGLEKVAILADVHVKHAAPPMSSTLEAAAADSWYRGLADALLVTGAGTGAATNLADAGTVRGTVPEAPVLVASGVTEATVRSCLESADGVIVGSAVMHGGRAGAGVDPHRARSLVRGARD
jgi:membrane complex biogenesis BtpA family protein